MKQNVYWYSLKNPHPTKPFSGVIKTSVAVIGGGMAGLSCAQQLNDAGISAVVIEKDFCGSGGVPMAPKRQNVFGNLCSRALVLFGKI
ncbi:FAD-dependent monooxygenase [Candidatus Berkelbacteria bacterium]|nr:FAD-dependent monooxygenase [Candidatus Berkelbacteria bacterium]